MFAERRMSEREAERKIADAVRKWLGIDEHTWIDVINASPLAGYGRSGE